MRNDSFSWRDATLNVWADPEKIPDLYDVARDALRKEGFNWRQDQEVKKRYKSLAKTHHEGRRGDLEFRSARHGCMFEMEFFQNVVFENRAGGRYDFDKLAKMPYLILLRFRKTAAVLTASLTSLGLANITKPKHRNAFDAVEARRRESYDWHKRVFDPSLRQSYNVKDADGVVLNDGDLRYYRGCDGRVRRGRVFYNLNNMWWVVHNETSYFNTPSHNLFTRLPEDARRRSYSESRARDRVKRHLDKAVAKMEFERAAKLRDAWFRLGGKIEVEA